ncbi:hypothetical protein GCM10009766_03940 [Microcella frigidaquae]
MWGARNMFEKRTLDAGDEPSPPQCGHRTRTGEPHWSPESVLELPMTLPLILILSLVGFFGLMVAIAGTGRRSRGAHRA